MLEVIIYPFPKFNGATVEVWEWISNFTYTLTGMRLLIMLGLKLNHVSKMGPWWSLSLWVCHTSQKWFCFYAIMKHKMTTSLSFSRFRHFLFWENIGVITNTLPTSTSQSQPAYITEAMQGQSAWKLPWYGTYSECKLVVCFNAFRISKMTSGRGHAFPLAGPLCRESSGHLMKIVVASDLWILVASDLNTMTPFRHYDIALMDGTPCTLLKNI